MTISNEIPAFAGQHPTEVDKRKLKNVSLHHLSWSQVLAEAVMQKEHRGVADPDQAYILSELIRYLEHPRSGALEFEDMGPSWVPVREAIAANTLRAGDVGVGDVAAKFDALLRFTSLRLGRHLGIDVVPNLSRKDLADPGSRTTALIQTLVADGRMEGSIKIPGAVAPVVVVADLRAGRVTCHVDVNAPREGRPLTRINWLIRQLRNAPEFTRLESSSVRSKVFTAAELLSVIREDPGKLIPDADRELRAFRVALSTQMGAKRGKLKGGFIDSVLTLVDDFYESILQNFKAWTPSPAKLREADTSEPVAAQLVATALSSQDGPEDVPATTAVAVAASVSLRSTAPTRHPSRRDLRLAPALESVAPVDRSEGWFQDTLGDGLLRWWDGEGWTEHTYELPEMRPAPVDA